MMPPRRAEARRRAEAARRARAPPRAPQRATIAASESGAARRTAGGAEQDAENNRFYSCHAGKRDGVAADNLSGISEAVDETDWVDEATARAAFDEVISRGTGLAETNALNGLAATAARFPSSRRLFVRVWLLRVIPFRSRVIREIRHWLRWHRRRPGHTGIR